MAYMNQTRKQVIADKVKPILKRYGVKGSLAVRNHCTIVLTLTEGKVDFIGDMFDTFDHGLLGAMKPNKEKLREQYYLQINQYWFQEHYCGDSYHLIKELLDAMKAADWYDRSDAMVDHFDTAYYIDINVGRWDKPYRITT